MFGNVIPGSDRIPGSLITAASATIRLIPTQGLRFLPDSSFLPFIDLIFGKIKAQSCEENGSLTVVTG